MADEKPIAIDPLSISSLYLKVHFQQQLLGHATGFVATHHDRHFLVTNWHVLSGRNAETDQPVSKTAGIPDHIRIAHHVGERLSGWRFLREPLFDLDGSPRWVAHPRGRAVDVACVELSAMMSDIRLFSLNLRLAEADLTIYPAMPVSVIGFPLGLRPNAFFAVWKTGHIASDPDLPYNGQPAFLIDATTRGGMSGSPVVARGFGSFMTSGGYKIGAGMVTRLLGIYSGRIHEDSEIGCVWKPEVITELLDHAVAARPPTGIVTKRTADFKE